jgi:hypothetical protein
MSSSSVISSLNSISPQISIYCGIIIIVAGVVGGVLNLIVFLSLQTFRQSPCGFYLTVMSFVNIGQLLTGLLSRFMISGFNIDWTLNSLFYCKCRILMFQVFTLISYTCLCLATIDQYFATCSRPQWQQWSNIKLARRLLGGISLIWILHGIPYGIFFNQVQSSTGKITCVATNDVFQQYRTYFVVLILNGLLPVIITATFGIMAHRNVQHLAYRAVPLVRRELDKQLTKMVLVQVIINCFTDVPYVITNILTLNPSITNDPVVWAVLQFINSITLMFFYSYFAVSRYDIFLFYNLFTCVHL